MLFSTEKEFRSNLNGYVESFDSKINIRNLITLQNKYHSLEVRFIQNGMDSTVFGTEKCLYFDPYHVGLVKGRIDNRSFALRIIPAEPKEGVDYYTLFKSHFDTLWRSSISFVNWMDSAKSKLPPSLPVLMRR